jgi:PKD repeat protein
MRIIIYSFITVLFMSGWLSGFSQESGQVAHPTLIVVSDTVMEVPSIASQIAAGTFIPDQHLVKEFNPKRWGQNTSVPGKGLPVGEDPLWQMQERVQRNKGKSPILTFEAASASATPTDPTGAVGPNHFVNSWNTSFRIWDKNGNPLIPAASLGTILPSTMGDPIVVYDRYADRFMITEFYSNGFAIALSKGADPVNSGWWVYQFATNTFPDYPKFSVWSDGYYITANKDQNTASTSQVVFAVQRDKMLTGDQTALMIGFPLTNIVTSGFYSPLAFNANGPTPPPAGDCPIVYMQDDSWTGVTSDHLKLWKINVNWTTPASSTISSPQIIATQPFDGLFDGGSFSNLPQPSGGDIDALQATIMYMAQYRRFSGYNSAVFNFVVDLNGNDNYAGIRWYELRQNNDGDPWYIYQEGTYSQPNGHSAFSGAMAQDMNGNIGMSYTIVSTSQYPSLRFTGRYASDPINTMTLTEEVIATGTMSDPATRYGDYAQMTIDPTDDATLWAIGEYFNGGRKNQVGVFQIAPPALTAQFTANPTTVCTGGSVTFTDQSLATPISWTWNFPGGTPSSYSGKTPPPITYSTPGSYDVSLTVNDGITTDTETKAGYITVKTVIANFTGTPVNVVIGNSVTFTDNSSCSPSTWEWSFPGGTPATYSGQIPTPITYSTLGTYDVSLTVTKPGGTDIKTRTAYITVSPPVFIMSNGSITTCTGDFYDSGGSSGSYQNNENLTMTFYPSTPNSMVKMTFTSFNTESGYDYLKIYNGTTTGATLIGSYNGTTGPGTVMATNAAGALTFNFTSDGSQTYAGWAATISCVSTTDPPIADFTASSVSPPINTTVTFTDLSANIPTSWAWTFSPPSVVYMNSTNANSQNPQVQFTAVGPYTVSLTVTNVNGSDTETKTNYINTTPCAPCSSTSNNATMEWISNVTLNTINNTSAGTLGYQDFTSISTQVQRGSTYPLSITCNETGTWTEHIWAFIDWNHDCDFADIGESYDLGQVSAPGTLTINVTVPNDAVYGTARFRATLKYNGDPTSCETFSYGQVEDYSVVVPNPVITTDLHIKAFLEGLYNGSNTMRQAYDASGPHFGAGVADQVTIELHSSSNYGIVANTFNNVNISTTGDVVMNGITTIPSGSYYITLKHRNSIETTTATPVVFSGGSVNYDFTTSASQAHGNNLLNVNGIYVIYSGDVNQDGHINTSDMVNIETAAGIFTNGYYAQDINGDAIVDFHDMVPVELNIIKAISSSHP